MKKCIALFALLLLAVLPALAAGHAPEVQGPTLANLFFYVQWSWYSRVPCGEIYTFAPTDDYYLRGAANTAVLGVGYTVLNFADRFLIDFEYDFSRPRFSAAAAAIEYHSLGMNFSYCFGRRRDLALTMGLGAVYRHWRNGWWNGDEQPYWLGLGLKAKLLRDIWLRADARFYGLSRRYWDEWDGWYSGYNDGDFIDFGTRLAVGLELHFH